MNYETGFARDSHDVEIADPAGPNRRRLAWIIAAVVAVIIVVALVAWSRSSSSGKAAADAAGGDKQLPTVSVLVPGRQTVDRVISATGNLAARREMPVGVAGEGGMVTQVLVEPGSWVRAGQVLATVDRRVQAQQVNALAAQIGVAEADVRLAQANLDRAQALVARGFISKADIDRLTSTRDAARARVSVARAQLAQERASTSRLDIRSPEAGLVLERRVEPGQIVSAGSGMLFRVAKGGEFELLARLGEGDLTRLTVGQRATVVPVGSQQAFPGQIWQMSPVIDPQTRQGIARISLPYDKALRPGGFASARIVSGAAAVPLLPESAIQSDAKGSYVLVVGAGNKVERRDVKIGDVSDAGVTILEGLTGQEAVVSSAGAFLNPGEKIIPQRVKTAS
jgi:RND family efflux transporter MFP subunit